MEITNLRHIQVNLKSKKFWHNIFVVLHGIVNATQRSISQVVPKQRVSFLLITIFCQACY